MSILDKLFGSNQQAQVQQQQPQAQNPAQAQVQDPNSANNTQLPNQNTMPPGNNGGEQSPMDNFKDLFTIDPNQQSQQSQQLFTLDPQKFDQLVSSQNFTQGIAQEDVAALTQAFGGNQEATKAALKIMNSIAQKSFGQSVQAGSKLIESGVQHTRVSLERDLPSHFKRQTAQDEIFTAHPELKSEAIRPLVGTVQQLIQQKNPNATTQEVNDLVAQYFTEVLPGAFGKTVQDKKVEQPTTPAEGNFASWLQ